MSGSYFPDDYEKADCFEIGTAGDLRPFLAHVLNAKGTDPGIFLDDLAKLVVGMRRDRALLQLTDAQWLLLETARLEGGVTVGRRLLATAQALASAGLVTVASTDDGYDVAPTGGVS